MFINSFYLLYILILLKIYVNIVNITISMDLHLILLVHFTTIKIIFSPMNPNHL
jgi:hypothetical protein